MAERETDPVVVIGLGRFGTTVATSLAARSHEVLALDSDARRVQAVSDEVTFAAQVDATDVVALRQLGIAEFRRAVVGIGDLIEASVLATSALVDLGVRTIWAKAVTPEQGRILERIGAHHVVYPEAEAGERVAHLVTAHLLDYIRFDDGFVIVKMAVPDSLVGRTLEAAALRGKHGVTVVGIKAPDAAFTYATPNTLLARGSTLAVAGTDEAIQRFAAVT